ncbi:MAG: dihydrolipoyl dehydrogenase [Porticoccaceae bacterium]|nr:dihydrolipoyl dehydrogenase [Porticoccaceae bacterium]
MAEKFDVVVIGGGPGGYVAAIRAAQLGFKTALVEREHLGGVCLNWGCIPTKALLKGAEVAHTLNSMQYWGFSADNISFDIAKLVAHSRGAADKLSSGIDYLLRKNNVAVFMGEAVITGKCKIRVTTENKKLAIDAMHIILATGARARQMPGLAIDGDRVWGAREAMTPTVLPKRLLIIGAGAIGMEFASLYRDLGSEVTVVEALERILPIEDREISQRAEKAFKRRGVDIQTASTVSSLRTVGDHIEANITGPSGTVKVQADHAIVAIGVTGNIDNLGLEALGVHTERGFITTDEWCKTNLVGLYAIGDVAGAPWLAHKASHEAMLCVERIAGETSARPLAVDHVPGCTYCRPQIASVGLTEDEAARRGINTRIGRFDLQASGKAVAINEPEGLVKTVFDAATGKLIGAHMIGPEVTEQIQGLVIAMGAQLNDRQLVETIFPHPTVSEAIHESILDSINRAIHQ